MQSTLAVYQDYKKLYSESLLNNNLQEITVLPIINNLAEKLTETSIL